MKQLAQLLRGLMESRNSQIITSLPLPKQIILLLVGDRPGNQLWSFLMLGALAIVALLVHSYNKYVRLSPLLR